MELSSEADKPLVMKITCCFKLKNENELIASTGVVKLNVSSKRDSPKKKKNTQNINRR